MNDAAVVRIVQPVADGNADTKLVGQAQGAPGGNDRLQAASFEIFHDQVGVAVLAAEIVDGDNILVLQAGRGPRFHVESLHQGWVRPDNHLDRHQPVQLRITGLVHHPHATPADQVDDLVLADFCGLADQIRPLFPVREVS